MRYSRALAATAAALTLILTGCSSTESSAGGDGFNDADVDFATDMIQHHAQALSMMDLTMGRELDPEMAELNEQIRAAPAPESERMVTWLAPLDTPAHATASHPPTHHPTPHRTRA